MTRGSVARRERKGRKPIAYVLYDAESITELVCVDCMTEDDVHDAPIYSYGAVICKRCGKVCE